MQELKNIDSTAINSLKVDPSAGTAEVEFKEGRKYLYTNVSVDSIYELLKNGADAFGQWVNVNLSRNDNTQFIELA